VGARIVGNREESAAARLGRRATKAWVAALGIVAALVLAGELGLQRLDRACDRLEAAIVEATAAREQIHRIAALLPELAEPERRSAALPELERAVELLRAARTRSAADGAGSAATTADPEAAARAAELDAFLARAERAVAAARSGEPEPPESLRRLRAEALGPGLEASAGELEALQRERVAVEERAGMLRVLVLTLILLAILAEGLWLFRPLTRRLVAQAAELERLARLDPTTGLLGRAAFLAALDRAVATRRPLALVLIDLDHFKETNDADGHAAGDAVLRAAAARIREVLRGGDTVGRLGGDELACLLPETAEARPLETVLNRLRTVLHEPVPFADRWLRAGATIGVARYPDDADSAERLLRAADEALMRAKRAQRGTVGRASPDDAPRIERLVAALRTLDAGGPPEELPGLDAALQPVVALGTEPLERAPLLGFEALARWHHPSLGALAPEELFPAAAATGRAARLGRAVRRKALAAFVSLGREAIAGRYLAVNLAPAEVLHGDLAAELQADLAEHGLPWSALCLEITEQVLLDRVSAERLDQLVRLHERGVRLALDDFGTGTSGLAQLLRLPIDILKIDRRFVGALPRDPKAREIVRATLGLAAGLGLEVVAEGIEEPAQAAFLASHGCRAGQGWLVGRPLQGRALAEFWRDRMRTGADPALVRS
jgi:diguanylate cyclase (GGDEF)-like protein